jgi:hypothetical protein
MRRSTAEKLGLADKIIAKHVATSVVGKIIAYSDLPIMLVLLSRAPLARVG